MDKVRKFKKRPLVIEAMQFDGTIESAMQIVNWALDHNVLIQVKYDENEDPTLIVETLEGPMIGEKDCRIVKGTYGEFYPVKGAIFENSYEEVTE